MGPVDLLTPTCRIPSSWTGAAIGYAETCELKSRKGIQSIKWEKRLDNMIEGRSSDRNLERSQVFWISVQMIVLQIASESRFREYTPSNPQMTLVAFVFR